MPTLKGSAPVQGPLWGTRARDWAEIQEPTGRDLYASVLATLALPPGARVLDVGCGSGVFCALATSRGMKVAGFDASEPLLALARERAPAVTFSAGDLEALPYPDASFGFVTGFNSFQSAADPLTALREGRRVLSPGGQLVLATWGRPEECEAAAYLQALGAHLPPPPPDAPGPFALSFEGAMAALTAQAGLALVGEYAVSTVWDYPDEAIALRGFLSAGPAIRALQHAGEPAVTASLRKVLEKFRQPSGRILLRNVFRYVVVRR